MFLVGRSLLQTYIYICEMREYLYTYLTGEGGAKSRWKEGRTAYPFPVYTCIHHTRPGVYTFSLDSSD